MSVTVKSYLCAPPGVLDGIYGVEIIISSIDLKKIFSLASEWNYLATVFTLEIILTNFLWLQNLLKIHQGCWVGVFNTPYYNGARNLHNKEENELN